MAIRYRAPYEFPRKLRSCLNCIHLDQPAGKIAGIGGFHNSHPVPKFDHRFIFCHKTNTSVKIVETILTEVCMVWIDTDYLTLTK